MELEELKYPIGRFQKPEVITPEMIYDGIAQIESLPAKLHKAVDSLTEEELNTHYRPGGWTIKQVVHHLADAQANAFFRFKLALTEENPSIKPYHEALWAEMLDANNSNIKSSLSIIDGIYDRWIILLKSMNEEDFERTFYHPERKISYTLATGVMMYNWHGNHHLQHILNATK